MWRGTQETLRIEQEGDRRVAIFLSLLLEPLVVCFSNPASPLCGGGSFVCTCGCCFVQPVPQEGVPLLHSPFVFAPCVVWPGGI